MRKNVPYIAFCRPFFDLSPVKHLQIVLLGVLLGVGGCEEAAPVNTAPSAPVLVEPKADATGVSPTITFVWEQSEDKELDRIRYALYLSQGDNSSFTRAANDLVATLYTSENALLASTKYFWYVVAIDEHGLPSPKSEVRSFNVADR